MINGSDGNSSLAVLIDADNANPAIIEDSRKKTKSCG
jgi:hypothetical protein